MMLIRKEDVLSLLARHLTEFLPQKKKEFFFRSCDSPAKAGRESERRTFEMTPCFRERNSREGKGIRSIICDAFLTVTFSAPKAIQPNKTVTHGVSEMSSVRESGTKNNSPFPLSSLSLSFPAQRSPRSPADRKRGDSLDRLQAGMNEARGDVGMWGTNHALFARRKFSEISGPG